MTRPSRRATTAKERQYRISELVDASGVSRDMIKYYLRAGLLPKPRKPRPNLSLYSENHLRLIRLILRIQQQTTLSLVEIATAFSAANFDPTTIELELLSDKYSAGRRDFILPFEAETKSNVSLSFPTHFIDELVSNGLLENTRPLDESQVEIAGLLWAARNEGVPVDFFQTARKKLLELADLEVKAMIAIRRPQLDFDAVVASVTSTDRIINRWIISEKTRQARRMFQRILDNSEQALATIHEAIYFPSKVFRQRFEIDTQLAWLQELCNANPADLTTLLSAGRACLLLTAFDQAVEFADAALAVAPDNQLALACKSLAYSMNRNLDQAQLYANLLEEVDSRHAIAMEARLLALLMQAAKLGGVSDTTDLLKNAAELFRDPVTAPPVDAFDGHEACLLQARANTIFPDAINSAGAAISDLEAMLLNLESRTYTELGLPIEGIRIVYQVYASFYLGQLYEATGKAVESRQYFAKVIQLDPSSNFGEKAYLKLG